MCVPSVVEGHNEGHFESSDVSLEWYHGQERFGEFVTLSSPIGMSNCQSPVRLVAQDTALSRRRHGFDSRTGRQYLNYQTN